MAKKMELELLQDWCMWNPYLLLQSIVNDYCGLLPGLHVSRGTCGQSDEKKPEMGVDHGAIKVLMSKPRRFSFTKESAQGEKWRTVSNQSFRKMQSCQFTFGHFALAIELKWSKCFSKENIPKAAVESDCDVLDKRKYVNRKNNFLTLM